MWSLRPDLNRRRRLCRPLLNHSATETGPALARVELGQLNVQVGKCCRRLSVRPFLAEPGAKTVEPTYIGVQHLLKLFRTSFGSRSLPLLACGLHRTLLARGVIGGLESVVLLLKFLEGRHGGYVFRQGCLLGNRLLAGSDTFCQKVSRFNHTNLLCTVDSGLQRGYRSHSRRPHRRTSRYGTVRCELAVGLARFEHAISWPPARWIDQTFPQPVDLSKLVGVELGAPDRIRTGNPRSRKPVRYPLRHGGLCVPNGHVELEIVTRATPVTLAPDPRLAH